MRVEVARRERNKLYAVIDVETKIYGTEPYTWEEHETKFAQITDIVKGLKLLGREVERVAIHTGGFANADFDTPYYKRYPEEVIDKLANRIGSMYSTEVDITVKNGRAYCEIDGYNIILPKDTRDLYEGNRLLLNIYLKDI